MAFVQQADNRASGATTCDVTLTGVGAGNLVVLNCMRTGATDRTLTTSDLTNGDTCLVAVAEAVSSAGGTIAEVAIDYVPTATGGNTTYRLTASGSTVIELDCIEFSHDGTATLDQSSTGDNASGTSHVCAAAGQIDTAAGAVVVTCIQFSGTTGGGSNPSGYTMSALAGNTRSGYKGPGAYTDENAAQTTVTSRYSIGAIASFAEVGGSGSQSADFSAGISAGGTFVAQSGAAGALSAGAVLSLAASALAGAFGALLAGLNAGESWAASAVTAGAFAANGVFDEAFGTGTANPADFAAGTVSSDATIGQAVTRAAWSAQAALAGQFLAAAQAAAQLVAGVSVDDITGAVAAAVADLTAGQLLGEAIAWVELEAVDGALLATIVIRPALAAGIELGPALSTTVRISPELRGAIALRPRYPQ